MLFCKFEWFVTFAYMIVIDTLRVMMPRDLVLIDLKMLRFYERFQQERKSVKLYIEDEIKTTVQ